MPPLMFRQYIFSDELQDFEIGRLYSSAPSVSTRLKLGLYLSYLLLVIINMLVTFKDYNEPKFAQVMNNLELKSLTHIC